MPLLEFRADGAIQLLEGMRMKLPKASRSMQRESANKTARRMKRIINLARWHKRNLLSKSIVVVPQSKSYVIQSSAADEQGRLYWQFVNLGTRPHDIPQKSGRIIKHPGSMKSRATLRFVDKAVLGLMKELGFIAKKHIKEVVRK